MPIRNKEFTVEDNKYGREIKRKFERFDISSCLICVIPINLIWNKFALYNIETFPPRIWYVSPFIQVFFYVFQ